MIPHESALLSYLPEDEYVRWKPLRPEMNVVGRLHHDDLARIVEGIENDEDMYDFCRLSDSWLCYVMEERSSGRPMAFCVLEIRESGHTVLFHGGRLPDYRNILKVCRGTAGMLGALLDMGFNVGTTTGYERSAKFMSGFGFSTYKTENGVKWMRMSRSSFENSLIVSRLHTKTNKREYSRDTHLKLRLNNILNSVTSDIHDYTALMDFSTLLRLKNLLGGVNNLITLQATIAFTDYLLRRGFIDTHQAAKMRKAIQSQHANANGYDIEYLESVPILAEVKCNIPVKGNDFGAAQKNGIIKDVKGLMFGKTKAMPRDAYKFMVILNTDSYSGDIDTRAAIARLMPKLNAASGNVMEIPADNSAITLNTIYIVNLTL